MGAHFRLPLFESSWKEISAYCRDLPVYAAMPSAISLYTEADWRGNWAFIVSNEAHGISKPARKLGRNPISIPMEGAAESINVASAAAVVLFEAQRQRLAAAQ